MNERVRVLITDDQQPTRQGLIALLSFAPLIEIVGEAVNGQEAVRMAGEHHPDVVIMDVKMPVMDGFQATRLIKARWPEIRVIALSIYPAYRTELFKAGADAFLLKGCTAKTLETAIFEASSLEKLSTQQ